MRLSMEKVRADKQYRIGYIPLIDEYVMALAHTTDEIEEDDYFRISPEVYALHRNSLVRLDLIAEDFRINREMNPAFLFSSEQVRNNEKQKELFFSCGDSQKERVTGEFERI